MTNSQMIIRALRWEIVASVGRLAMLSGVRAGVVRTVLRTHDDLFARCESGWRMRL